MRASLVTLGSPQRQTGGYLYHRRLAELAPEHEAAMEFVSIADRAFPLPMLGARKAIDRAHDADVVVVDSIVAAYAGPWLRRRTRPAVGMLHQPPGGIDHGVLRTRVQATLDAAAYRRMDKLLVASESLGDAMRPLHPHVVVVPPGRDVAQSADSTRHDLRNGRRAALLCVGNWVPRKGIIDLLDAFALLPDDLATLHLAGDDEADPRYAKRVRARVAAIGDRVVAHGPVSKERVAALYRDADVFVMASYREPYGTVYGEAMAAGLPVVGWRAGNLPYLAREEVDGIVVDPGDIGGLADALRRLATDDVLRAQMAEAARARAASFPTWAETAAMFFAELRRVADNRG